MRWIYFYPRPPCGGRHITSFRIVFTDPISIHALRVEGDYRFYHDNGDYTSGSAPVVRYSTSRSAAERTPVTSYPTNAKGETYGSYLDRNK